MVSVQPEGCAPIVRAFHDGKPTATEWQNATTVADGLRVPKAFGDFLILKALRDTQGTGVAVSDAEMVRDMYELGTIGISASPEGAASMSAVKRLVAEGRIGRDETVVLFNTGGALKYLDLVR